MAYLCNALYSIITVFGMVVIASNLMGERTKKPLLYQIVVITFFIFLKTIMPYDIYSPKQTFITFILLILTLQILFDEEMIAIVVLSLITIIITLVSNLILGFSLYLLEDSIFIEEYVLLFALVNLCSISVGYLFSKMHALQMLTKIYIEKIAHSHVKNDFMIIVLITFTMFFFNYQFFINRYVDGIGITFIVYILVLLIVLFIYLYDKVKYTELIDKYDSLFQYACTFEEELEKDTLMRHEYKNQLAAIRDVTKDQKVITYIDDILSNNKRMRDYRIKGINNLPKGGLRGIIYYKVVSMRHNGINFVLDISRSVKEKLSKLSQEETKVVSYIIGVCGDNAIEECINDCDSNISIEIYDIGRDIHIIFSNSIINHLNPDKVGNKGYTTKGKNHGNGLFMVKKMLRHYSNISLNTKIINNYFIQELKIVI